MKGELEKVLFADRGLRKHTKKSTPNSLPQITSIQILLEEAVPLPLFFLDTAEVVLHRDRGRDILRPYACPNTAGKIRCKAIVSERFGTLNPIISDISCNAHEPSLSKVKPRRIGPLLGGPVLGYWVPLGLRRRSAVMLNEDTGRRWKYIDMQVHGKITIRKDFK